MRRAKRPFLRLRRPQLLQFIVLLGTAQIGLAQYAAHPRGLSDSQRRVLFEGTAFTGPSTPLPEWSNGYLITREIETVQEGVPNVRLYDRSGRKVREAAIWFPGSQRVMVYSATATAEGRIVAGGKAEKVDGAMGPFIALTDTAGKVTDVIQTRGFYPVNICEAPDGTVWSFGSTGYDDASQPIPGDTLRHFDLRKGEIGSYLPRSSFPNRPLPENKAYIRCLANEVVAYSTNAQEYIELSYAGGAPRLYHAGVPASLKLAGFAATGSRMIYGHFFHQGSHGLYYLSFDEAPNTVRWLAVQGTVGDYTTPGVITGLWGSDVDQLVVNRAEDSAGMTALHWTAPLNQ